MYHLLTKCKLHFSREFFFGQKYWIQIFLNGGKKKIKIGIILICNIKKKPKGMRKITITGLCNLLKNMSYIPLLPYQRIHQPLSNLLDIFCDSLRNKYKNKSESRGEKNDVDSSEEIEEDEFMGLLDTITIKLQEVPNGIHFFIKPPASASSPFPASYFSLFDCLLLYFRLHSPNGERARASILRILHSISPPDPQIISR